MFVLTLTITDPEDAGYFTNKTLNKLHGYMRHQSVKLALFFTLNAIKVYATDKATLDDLLVNEAVCFDIKRHIFKATISPVDTESILVLKRIHNTVHSVNKKVTEQANYYRKKFTLTDTELKEKKKERAIHYKAKKEKQDKLKRHYFVIKNKHKSFSIWVEVRTLNVTDFETTSFNSYGLLSVTEKKEHLIP